MDLSGLIFVALAVAWAAYLIPKALKHHEDVVRSRSVDRFSGTMRVLARREPVNRRNARLVVTPGRPTSQVEVAVKGEAHVTTADQLATRRATTNRAARRRRRVLLVLLLANVAVVAVATANVIAWWWVAAPAGLLLAWLVACRLMVRRERTWTPSAVERVVDALVEEALEAETAERPAVLMEDAETGAIVAVVDDPSDPAPVGPRARHLADVRRQGRRPAKRAHHRPRRHRRVVLRPQRGRQPAGPRRRGGRAHRALRAKGA